MAQIVPLSNAPNQTLAVTLTVDGNPLTLNLTIHYNEIATYWVLAIADANQNPLLVSIPMITGYYPAGNLLQQYAYLRIGSAYMINASGTTKDSPDSTNLGSDFVLLWDDTPSV